MRVELTEIVWSQAYDEMSGEELAEASGVPIAELDLMIDHGILVPKAMGPAPRTFPAESIAMVQTARRLRQDFGLDMDGLALAMRLLARIHDLERQVRQLTMRIPSRG